MALKPLTFLFALVFSASTYLAPIAYAESASPQHRKAGNLEQAVLGNSYLWQHTTNTEYDGFEKEISWQCEVYVTAIRKILKYQITGFVKNVD